MHVVSVHIYNVKTPKAIYSTLHNLFTVLGPFSPNTNNHQVQSVMSYHSLFGTKVMQSITRRSSTVHY